MTQFRFSFEDSARAAHSLTLIQGPSGQQGAAVLDGKWIVLHVLPGEGRALYRSQAFEFHVESDRWGIEWKLVCAGRTFEARSTTVITPDSVLSKLGVGPFNELVDNATTYSVLERHGWKPADGAFIARPRYAPRDFKQMLVDFTPRLWVTPGIVVLTTMIYFAMLFSGVYSPQGGSDRLLAWGADYAPYVTSGQWWRLLTATFLHIGFFHLLFNLAAFCAVGPMVERIVGNLGFLVLYIVSGLFGSLASLYASAGPVSLGASGSIFGVYGALLGLLSRYHVYLRRKHVVIYITVVALMLTSNVLQNLPRKPFQSQIDMPAHLGGLLAGFFCGVVMNQPVSPEAVSHRRMRNFGVMVVGLAVVLLLAALRPKVCDVMEAVNDLGKVQQHIVQTYNAALQRAQSNEISQMDLSNLVEHDLLREWASASERFSKIVEGAPRSQREIALRFVEFANLWRESMELLARALRINDPLLMERAKAKRYQADTTLDRLRRDMEE